jgi:hypothetical protein
MTTFKHVIGPEDKGLPEMWWGTTNTVLIVCPKGHKVLLINKIADDGTVLGEVICPAHGCNFRDAAKLQGWGR